MDKKDILNRINAKLKYFSGTDIQDYDNLLSLLDVKKQEIEILKQIAANYIIKNNINISSISFYYKDGKRIYGDHKYQEYMDRIQELRKEIKLIEENPIIKNHSKKR